MRVAEVKALYEEKVAIKMLEKAKIMDESDRERVSREIQILKVLRHPNVTQLYQIIEDETNLYLIMEYSEGGELFEHIVSEGRIKETEACRFFQQIIDGVEYIHSLNIVHRDLKPENLLLDEKKNIKIVDFGLSNLYGEKEWLKTACGSPCYAAPEMIAGKKYKGLESDIWSAGVILFALICGYLPFDDSDTQMLYRKIMKGEYAIPSFVSTAGTDLIKRVLQTDPEKRFGLEEIKSHEWFALNKGYAKVPKGLIVGYHEVPMDEMVLEHVEGFGFEKEVIRKSVAGNKHNRITALYYLLLQKFTRNGLVSPADISQICFRARMIKRGERKSGEMNNIEEISEKSIRVPGNNEGDQFVEHVLKSQRKKILEKSTRANLANLNNTTVILNEDQLKGKGALNSTFSRYKASFMEFQKERKNEQKKKRNRTIELNNKNSLTKPKKKRENSFQVENSEIENYVKEKMEVWPRPERLQTQVCSKRNSQVQTLKKIKERKQEKCDLENSKNGFFLCIQKSGLKKPQKGRNFNQKLFASILSNTNGLRHS